MRLREETEFRPKPLVEIGGRPILWHIMQHYAYHGHNEFVLCLGYRGDDIKRYFLNYQRISNDFTVDLAAENRVEIHGEQVLDWKVTCADTGREANTGARLKKIERFITGDEFMLTYGDGVADIDLEDLLRFHREQGRLATVTGVFPPARFGELEVDNGRALEFREKPQTQRGRISGGFFVLHKKVFDYLSDDDSCNFERGPLAQLAAEGQLAVYQHDGFWQCMDTFRDFTLLNDMWDAGDIPWRTGV